MRSSTARLQLFSTRRLACLSMLVGLVMQPAAPWADPLAAQEAAEAQAEDAVTVKVLDFGSEPRRKIRFTPETGAEQIAVMTMDMQMKMTIGGQQPPQAPLPPQKMTMKVTVDDVKPNGDIAYSFTYTDIEVVNDPKDPSPLSGQMEQMMKPMIGMSGKGVTTNRGLTLSGSIDVPANAAPAIKQQLDGMKDALNRLSSPVPEEAIGVGARWTVTQTMEANGLKLTQTSTHELTELSDNGFVMSIKLDQTADPQNVKNPNLPANVKVKLQSLKTTGQGTSSISTLKVLPVNSKVSAESNAEMSIDVGGQQQSMSTNTTIKTTMEPPAKK